jgi:type I restriction enzyme, S subunit
MIPRDESHLPPGWCWTTLGELLREPLRNGHSAKASQSGEGVRTLTLSAVTYRNFCDENTKLTVARPESVSDLWLQPGDIFIERSNTPELVGTAALYGGPANYAIFPDLLIRVRPHREVSERYIAAVLDRRETRWYFRRRAQGIAGSMPKIDQQTVELLRVPLAPATEQRRIVAKIEELFSDLDAGVAALERANANLKRYRAAVLMAAVGGRLTAEWRENHPHVEPASKLLDRILAERRRRWEAEQEAKFAASEKAPPKNWREKCAEPMPPDTENLPELPNGWCWARLDQLIVYLRNGYFQRPTDDPGGIRLLRINAVRPMRVDLNEVKYLKDVTADLSGYYVEDGDLLFTRYNGSLDLLGVVGMVRGCTEATVHPDKLIRVKAPPFAPLNEYLELACNVGWSRKHMRGRARTTAGQTGISGDDIRSMPVPLPPREEQQQILASVAERISHIAAAEEQIAADLRRAGRLRQSILKWAFEGKLVPQDPDDEPAGALLERIKAERGATSTNRTAANGRKSSPGDKPARSNG